MAIIADAEKEVLMQWEKAQDGSWKITPITVDEGKFLDAVFAALTAWKNLGPKALVKHYTKSTTDRCKE